MLSYISKRILLPAFTMWVISLLTFVVMQLPAGLTPGIIPARRGLPPADLEAGRR